MTQREPIPELRPLVFALPTLKRPVLHAMVHSRGLEDGELMNRSDHSDGSRGLQIMFQDAIKTDEVVRGSLKTRKLFLQAVRRSQLSAQYPVRSSNARQHGALGWLPTLYADSVLIPGTDF